MTGDTYYTKEKQLQEENNVLRSKIEELEEDVKRLRLMLRGWTDEHFTLRVELDPHALHSSKNMRDVVFDMQRTYVRAACHELDRKMGGLLRRHQEAVMHIDYLENHAANNGLNFTPWAVNELDRSLYY